MPIIREPEKEQCVIQELQSFINLLAGLEAQELCFNPYASGDSDRDSIRCNNLLLYLQEMHHAGPREMLVGEAPGYNGCHWTGIPFTSERELQRGVPAHGLFGLEKGYRWTSDKELGYTEPSGTILWSVISELPRLPLVWNAFPLHPYKSGNLLSNRTPTEQELVSHAAVLHRLAEIFEIESFIAVGHKAERVLAELGISAPRVRHPANGGKAEFSRGLHYLLGRQ